MMVLLGLTRSYESMRRHMEKSENKRYLLSPLHRLEPAAWPPHTE